MPKVENYGGSLRHPDDHVEQEARRLRRREKLGIGMLAVASVLTLPTFAVILMRLVGEKDFQGEKETLSSLAAVFAALATSVSYVTFTSLRIKQGHRYRVRISLTGQPAAGKTVFSILLYHIISFYTPKNVKFSAETENVIEVFRALRGFSEGEWPKSTPTDGVSLMKGELVSRSQFGGQSTFEVSIADTAGEYWADLNEDTSPDHPYLALIATSDAIVHVVPVSELKYDDDLIKRDTLDLLMASQLMAHRRRSFESRIPLLVVFSKCDGENVEETVVNNLLFKVYNYNEINEQKMIDDRIICAIKSIEERLSSRFSIRYLLSSALEIQEKRLPSDLVNWVIGIAAR